MTVSLRATSRKYRGRKAETYEAIRKKQERWDAENSTVSRMLRDTVKIKQENVLDVPVGTGRFLKLYRELQLLIVGVDVSEEMLALARRKKVEAELIQASADELDVFDDRKFDHVVCVRFLDLIDEDAMRTVMSELMRVARRQIVLTIRLGERYVPKSNTATHDERRFTKLVRGRGFRISEKVPVFKQGWFIMRLERNGR